MAKLGVTVNVIDYSAHQQVVVPLIDLDHPAVEAVALPSGRDNYTLQLASSDGGSSTTRFGKLDVEGGWCTR